MPAVENYSVADYATQSAVRSISELAGALSLVLRLVKPDLDEFVVSQRLLCGGDDREAEAGLAHLNQWFQSVGQSAQVPALVAGNGRGGHRSSSTKPHPTGDQPAYAASGCDAKSQAIAGSPLNTKVSPADTSWR
jgi:hypothetical protein